MMTYNLSLLIVMALLVMAASFPIPPPTRAPTERPTTLPVTGGFLTIDPKGISAQNATKYAVSIAYPSTPTKFKVLTARTRAYLGLLYDLNVAVTFTRNRTCSVHNYQVIQDNDYNGIQGSYSLFSTTALTSQKCKCKWATRDMIQYCIYLSWSVDAHLQYSHNISSYMFHHRESNSFEIARYRLRCSRYTSLLLLNEICVHARNTPATAPELLSP